MGLGDCRTYYSTDASDLLLLFCHYTGSEEKGDQAMNISWEMILPLIVLQLALAVFALISCIKEERTNGPKVDVGCNHRMYQYYRLDFIFHRRQKAKVSRYAVCLLNHYANRTGIMKL